MKINKLKTVLLILVLSMETYSAPVPQYSKEKHMGVATCASGVCHGKSVEDPSENVLMNEYRTWLKFDDHSKAYKTLLKPASKKMAAKLGLKSAQTAKICLDCHADNVPQEKRGKRFQISDGVTCESCHGGAENWLSDHKEKGATHEKNIKLGLYPSERPRDRAKLCLSCHLGTANKFATHRIMGAGHPRLNLELEVFTQSQPAHYKIDADYEERKGSIRSVNMWVNGLLFKAYEQLALLQTKQFKQHGLFPELSFYECHSCHRNMAPTRWPIEKGSNNVPAGTVRLDDSSLVVLISVVELFGSINSADLKSGLKALHNASVVNKTAMIDKAKVIQSLLNKISTKIISKRFTKTEKKNIRKKLLLDVTKGLFRDYSSADQVFMALETLTIDLKDENKHKKILDQLYDKIDEDNYYPDQFQAIAGLFLRSL